jgi:hypothetical protein
MRANAVLYADAPNNSGYFRIFLRGWAGLRDGARDGAEFALHMDLEQGG